MSQTISAFRNRLQVDTSDRTGVLEKLNGGNPFFWNGSCAQFELAFFRKETLIADLSNISELRVELKPFPSINSTALMSETILGDDVNSALTLDEWNAGAEDDCHAKIFFGSDVTNLDLGGDSDKQFWLVISAKRIDGQTFTLGCTQITVAEDGSSLEASAPSTGSFRYNGGLPESKFSDGTWHQWKPVIGQGQYLFDIEPSASNEIADGDFSKTRFNDGRMELLYSDDTWHALEIFFDQGQYTMDVIQEASATFTQNTDRFRQRLGYTEMRALDLSWHRNKPIFDQGKYILDTEQSASV